MKKTIIPTTLLAIALLAPVTVSGRLHAHTHTRELAADEFTVLTSHYSQTGGGFRHFGSYTSDGSTTWDPTDLGRPVDEYDTPVNPWAVAYDFCVEKVYVIVVTVTAVNPFVYTSILAVMTPSISNTELDTIGVMKTDDNEYDYSMKALAVNPITNELYGYDGLVQLYKIDRKTATLEPIGYPQPLTDCSAPLDMSFDSSGQLYLMCPPDPAVIFGVQVFKVDSIDGSISLYLEVDTPYNTKYGNLFHHLNTNTDTEDLFLTSQDRLYQVDPATGSASLASDEDEQILIGMRGGDIPKPYPPRNTALIHTFDDFTMLTTHVAPTGFRHFGSYTTDGITTWDRSDLGRPVDETGTLVDPWAVAYDNGGEKVYVIVVTVTAVNPFVYTSILAVMTPSISNTDLDTIGVMKTDNNEYDYMKALAVNPITNELYGYDGLAQLYKINKETAALEPIGRPVPQKDCSAPLDMSFDSWGQLYLMCPHAGLNGVLVFKVNSIRGTISFYLKTQTPYQTNYGSLLHHWAETEDLLFTSQDRLYQVWPATGGLAFPSCPETRILIGMRGGDAPNPRTSPILLAVDQLYADIEAYIAEAQTFQNPQKVLNAIYEKVEMAFEKAVNSGKPDAAAGIIDGVIAKIQGYVADGLLTEKEGAQIIKDLEELRDLFKNLGFVLESGSGETRKSR